MSVDFNIGENVPGTHYRVVLRIGQGGMGSVFEVEHVELGKRFVLKALLPQFLERKDLVQRLRNEWRSLGRLEHPNIVSVTDAGVSRNGVPFYVMERLQGETLASALKARGHLMLADAIRFGCEILEGLSAAHEIGVVHRDVKPPNIFLTQGGSAKILDFGIAKLLDGASLELTGKGIAIGTPRYMSPEQAAGEPVDGRADLYAVGLLLFEMISGVGPFDGGDSNEVFLAHLTKQPPRLSALVPGIPMELDGLVALLLAKHPAERPASASAAAKALRGILRCVPQVRPDTVASPLSLALTPVIPLAPMAPRPDSPKNGAPKNEAQRHDGPEFGAAGFEGQPVKAEPRVFRGLGRPSSRPAPLGSQPPHPGFPESRPARLRTPAPLAGSPADADTLGLASPSVAALAATFEDAPPTRTAVPLPSTPPPVASSSRPPPWSAPPPSGAVKPTHLPAWPWITALGLSCAVATLGVVWWLNRVDAPAATFAAGAAAGAPSALNPMGGAVAMGAAVPMGAAVAPSGAGGLPLPAAEPGLAARVELAAEERSKGDGPSVYGGAGAGGPGGVVSGAATNRAGAQSNRRGSLAHGGNRAEAVSAGVETEVLRGVGNSAAGNTLPAQPGPDPAVLRPDTLDSKAAEPAPAKTRLPGPGFPHL